MSKCRTAKHYNMSVKGLKYIKKSIFSLLSKYASKSTKYCIADIYCNIKFSKHGQN